MSVIDIIIGKANFELVRAAIASILIDELANQKDLNQTALDTELAKPIPDPILVAEYQLNISSIPNKVWEERFKRPQPEEYTINPVINVIMSNAPLNTLQTASTQLGDNTYIIEVYSGERELSDESPEYEGDALASIKLQRLLAICRGILMDQAYCRLGFDTQPYFIGHRSVNSIQIAQPDDGIDNTNNMIYGKCNVTVKMNEGVRELTGVQELNSQTTQKLFDEEKGYFWTNQSNS